MVGKNAAAWERYEKGIKRLERDDAAGACGVRSGFLRFKLSYFLMKRGSMTHFFNIENKLFMTILELGYTVGVLFGLDFVQKLLSCES